MPSKHYFLTFIYFDTKHQRTNKFSHLSIALMEGNKQDDNTVKDMELLDCDGYYSHKMPEGGSATSFNKFLKTFLNINFRLQNYYAEFKQEDLINLDLGFGIEGGPIIEITEEEKINLERNMKVICQNERHFFAEADKIAKEKLATMQISDPKKRKAVENELRTLYREKHYENELATIDDYISENHLKPDLLLAETAFKSGLISAYRFQQEKLRIVKNIEFFEFSFSPQGRTCKTMGLELVLKSLTEECDQGARKFFLSQLFSDQYYTRSLPLAKKHSGKMIYHSTQDFYTPQHNRPPLPNRAWGNNDFNCKLAVCDVNNYIDLQGKQQDLRQLDHPKVYNQLIENLILLQRLLNDFCDTENNFQTYLSIIGQSIRAMITNADNIENVIAIYHETLKGLYSGGCFAEISQHVFKTQKPLCEINLTKHLQQIKTKVEDGVKVELSRLAQMERQAQQTSLTESLLCSSHIFNFFSHRPSKQMVEPVTLNAHKLRI